MSDATSKLELAQKHLEKVQIAWDDPTDWADLSLRILRPGSGY